MILYYKKALQDLFNLRFLNTVTAITIALSILIASAFLLFFANANTIIGSWKQGIRVMAYLRPNLGEKDMADLRRQIQELPMVQRFTYISKDKALKLLKQQMHRQSSLFENLKDNPLPNAMEIRMAPAHQGREQIETLARKIEAIPAVAEVEYGQQWLVQFSHIINLFRLAGYALVGLFCLAAIFIVANTIRLILYSRRDEIEVMRLVGATDGFIKTPFYIQGIILGGLGGVVGLVGLYIVYASISSRVAQGLATGFLRISFFSPGLVFIIIITSMLVGWFGCYLSLKQFLKS
jgi:cell division transport system permease protein